MGSKITAEGECSHEIKRRFADTINGAKAYADDKVSNLDADVDAATDTTITDTEKVAVVTGVTEADGIITGVDSIDVDTAGAATRAKNAVVGCHCLLGSTLKSRDITFPTKVHLIKAMIFPVVMYGCESWTIKKAECRRTDAFKLWCRRKLLRVPWMARRSNQSIQRKSTMNIQWKN